MGLRICNEATSRRELRKQDRRQAIVAAARCSFLEHGYAATSMSGLLKVLGGSKATLWAYFPTKEELFAAVIEELAADFRAELKDALALDRPLEPTLVTFCTALLNKISAPENVAIWRLVVAESGRFPELGQIFYERAVKGTQSLLAEYLAHQIAGGHLIDGDPVEMAEGICGMCTYHQNRALWGMAPAGPEHVRLAGQRVAQWFLRGFGR